MITIGLANATVQYANFGPKQAFSGRLVKAQPPEANAPLVNEVKGAIAVVYRGKASIETKMRYCSAAGALGVVLINLEDERFLAAPDPPETRNSLPEASSIPLVVVSSSDGVKLLAAGDEANIEPFSLEVSLPLFPFGKPLLPGSSLQVAVGEAERHELEKRLQASSISSIKAVTVMSKDMRIAQVGTLASVELPAKESDSNIVALHGQRPCKLRSLLRWSTPELFGLVLLDSASLENFKGQCADAKDEMEALFRKFEYNPSDDMHLDPERLSFELCSLIQLNSIQMQAALELDTVGRLRAISDQFSINPKRGRELLAEAVGKSASA